jgi:Ser/Thr protein kinase RdoA (MazF antagonist)
MNESKHRLNLWQAWPIEGPWHLTPLSGGKNKQVWRAEAANGQCYVLRLIPDVSYIPHLRYEAALLEAVSHQHPPFLLPLPLQAHNGDIVVPCEQEAERWTFATLSPLLPGHLLFDRNDLVIATNAADALA